MIDAPSSPETGRLPQDLRLAFDTDVEILTGGAYTLLFNILPTAREQLAALHVLAKDRMYRSISLGDVLGVAIDSYVRYVREVVVGQRRLVCRSPDGTLVTLALDFSSHGLHDPVESATQSADEIVDGSDRLARPRWPIRMTFESTYLSRDRLERLCRYSGDRNADMAIRSALRYLAWLLRYAKPKPWYSTWTRDVEFTVTFFLGDNHGHATPVRLLA